MLCRTLLTPRVVEGLIGVTVSGTTSVYECCICFLSYLFFFFLSHSLTVEYVYPICLSSAPACALLVCMYGCL